MFLPIQTKEDRRLYHFVEEAVGCSFGGTIGGLLTQVDKFAILVAFCGVSCADPKYDRKTFCLGFIDGQTGRHVYQTVPVVSFHYTPFCLEIVNNRRGVLHCDSGRIRMYLGERILVSLGGTFLRPTNHHFNQFDRNLELLPVSLIANPRSFCSENCVGCSRTALGLHKEQRGDFIERHIAEVDADFASTFPGLDKSELKYVSVSTGCECSRAEEVQMFLRLVGAYREHGFSPEFVIFSNKIRRQRDMKPLHAGGVVGYVATIEVINDRLRERLWGKSKGERLLIQHLRSLVRARQIFPFVEATLVLGFDEYEELIDGISILGDLGVSIIGNVLRSYSAEQYAGIHDDVWDKGIDYLFEAFEKILAHNVKNRPTARRLREHGLAYLSRRADREVKDSKLPYKYRG